MNHTTTLESSVTNQDVGDAQVTPCKHTVQPKNNRKEIDGSFSNFGSEKRFLDGSHSPLRPHIRMQSKSAPLILHVDDDADLVDAVTSRLKAAGYRVASAMDGGSGLAKAQSQPTNAIILDFDMPNGRGDRVIDMLRRDERTQDIPIIVLTAVHQKHLKRTLLNKGANAFMTKPFEFSELQETLSMLLDGDDDSQ